MLNSSTSVPTTGGSVVVSGQNFGMDTTQIHVTIDGKPCAVQAIPFPHTQVSCQIGAGVGADLEVEIEVAGQTTRGSIFSYQGN